MGKPLIQIDDIGTTREMTDEELAAYDALTTEAQFLPVTEEPSE